MPMYLKDGSASTSLRAAALIKTMQMKLAFSPSHSLMTPGQPILTLALKRRVPDRVSTRVPIFHVIGKKKKKKTRGKRGSDIGLSLSWTTRENDTGQAMVSCSHSW